jgi:hypothetical protein
MTMDIQMAQAFLEKGLAKAAWANIASLQSFHLAEMSAQTCIPHVVSNAG